MRCMIQNTSFPYSRYRSVRENSVFSGKLSVMDDTVLILFLPVSSIFSLNVSMFISTKLLVNAMFLGLFLWIWSVFTDLLF